MGIKEKNTAPKGNNGQQDRDFEKAKGFINIAIKLKSGDQVRLASVPLRESNMVEGQLAEWLTDALTRDERLLKLVTEKLVLSYNPTRSAEELKLDL